MLELPDACINRATVVSGFCSQTRRRRKTGLLQFHTVTNCLVLIMSPQAGFGRRQLSLLALENLRHLQELAGDRLMRAVDGGLNRETIGSCAQVVADSLVVGLAVFGDDEYGPTLEQRSAQGRAS